MKLEINTNMLFSTAIFGGLIAAIIAGDSSYRKMYNARKLKEKEEQNRINKEYFDYVDDIFNKRNFDSEAVDATIANDSINPEDRYTLYQWLIEKKPYRHGCANRSTLSCFKEALSNFDANLDILRHVEKETAASIANRIREEEANDIRREAENNRNRVEYEKNKVLADAIREASRLEADERKDIRASELKKYKTLADAVTAVVKNNTNNGPANTNG